MNFPFQLSCPKCEKMSVRVFEDFLIPTSIKAEPAEYIVLNWLCCGNKVCRNCFQKFRHRSRCPVCKKWSVFLQIENIGDKIWKCQDKSCGWSFQISKID